MTEEEKREIIRSDLKKNLFIEAGAGAGKTTLLVDRAVNLLCQEGVDPSQVVIITFTNAAASELYERIVRKLRERKKAAEEKGETSAGQKLRNALDHIDRMDISTIHHFCNAMLHERIFDAGLGMNAQYSEEDETIETKKAFLMNALSRKGADRHIQVLKDVLGKGYRNDLENLFCQNNMADQEDAEYIVDEEVLAQPWSFYKDRAYELLKEIDDIIQRSEESIFECYRQVPLRDGFRHEENDIYAKTSKGPNESEEDRKTYKEIIERALAEWDHGNDGAVVPALKKFSTPKKGKGTFTSVFSAVIKKMPAPKEIEDKAEKKKFTQLKKTWKNQVSAANDEVKDILSNEVGPLKEQIEAYQAGTAVKFTAELAEKYRAERDSSKISNDTLLYRTRDLLKNEKARKALSDRYRYLFVDEYQDTDQLQTEIIKSLTCEEKDRNRLKPGSLVVVGDPKQSIYRFRGADSSLFGVMKQFFKRLQSEDPDHNEVLVLHDNYRSSKAVIDAVNDRFSRDYPDSLYEPMHVSSEREQAGLPDDTLHGVYGCYVKDLEEQEAEKKAKDEGKEISFQETEVTKLAALIQKLCHGHFEIMTRQDGIYKKRSIRYSDILVLNWNKDGIRAIVDELKKNSIPVSVMGRINIRTSPLERLVYIVEYLADPKDSISTAAAAQSFYGCELSEISKEDYQKLVDRLEAFRYLVSHMSSFEKQEKEGTDQEEKNKKEMEQDGLYDLTEISIHKDACALIRWLSRHEELLFDRSADLSQQVYYDQKKQLQNLVESVEQNGLYDLNDAVQFLENYLTEEHEREAELVPDKVQVRVMNVHKSKGLQAPVVIVMEDRRRSRKTNYQEGNRHYMVLSRTFGSLSTYACNEKISEKADQANADDQLNLDYVVDTRAGEVLIQMIEKEEDKDSSVVLDCPPNIEHFTGKINTEGSDAETDNLPVKVITAEEIFRKRKEEAKKGDALKVSLFNSVTPSSFENVQSYENGDGTLQQEERPKGSVFGTIMHRCFELYVNRMKNDRTPGISAVIAQAVMENLSDIPAEDVPKYHSFLTKVLTSFQNHEAIMNRIRQAAGVYTEFPFSYYIKKEDASDLIRELHNAAKTKAVKDILDFDSDTLYIHGACDLVLKNQDGSISVIDYKSDQRSISDLERFRAMKQDTYAGQLLLYKHAMSKVWEVPLDKVSTELYLIEAEK